MKPWKKFRISFDIEVEQVYGERHKEDAPTRLFVDVIGSNSGEARDRLALALEILALQTLRNGKDPSDPVNRLPPK